MIKVGAGEELESGERQKLEREEGQRGEMFG